MRIIYILTVVLVLIAGKFSIFSQENNEKQPIILRYADSLVGTRGPGMDIREFVGNVVLIQGDVTVKCDRAIQYLQANKAVLTGNVHINQKELDLYTQEGVYYGNTKIATTNTKVKITDGKTTLTAGAGTYSTLKRIADFRNDVKIEDDSVIIYSDRLVYHKDNKNSYAYGNVLLRGKYTETYLLGDTIEHFPNDNLTYVKGNPRLFRIDTIETSDKSLDTLEENKMFDNTVVLITGDHGEEFGEHGFFGHNSAFTIEHTKVPMIIYVPWIKEKTYENMTSHLDIPATMLHLLGYKDSPGIYSDGFSMIDNASKRNFNIACGWNNCSYFSGDYYVNFSMETYNTGFFEIRDKDYREIPYDKEKMANLYQNLMKVIKDFNKFSQ
jgi:lipopolysaccharide export system protein LptA